jgi:F0F1-type ATP synthase assembly protein I
MRYRLRTLVMLTAIGPPALAAIWFAPAHLPPEAAKLAIVLLGFALVVSIMAAVIAVPLLLGWILSLLARLLIYLLVHPNNRQ